MRQILIRIGKYKDIGYKGYEAVLPGHNIPVWCTCKRKMSLLRYSYFSLMLLWIRRYGEIDYLGN